MDGGWRPNAYMPNIFYICLWVQIVVSYWLIVGVLRRRHDEWCFAVPSIICSTQCYGKQVNAYNSRRCETHLVLLNYVWGPGWSLCTNINQQRVDCTIDAYKYGKRSAPCILFLYSNTFQIVVRRRVPNEKNCLANWDRRWYYLYGINYFQGAGFAIDSFCSAWEQSRNRALDCSCTIGLYTHDWVPEDRIGFRFCRKMKWPFSFQKSKTEKKICINARNDSRGYTPLHAISIATYLNYIVFHVFAFFCEFNWTGREWTRNKE